MNWFISVTSSLLQRKVLIRFSSAGTITFFKSQFLLAQCLSLALLSQWHEKKYILLVHLASDDVFTFFRSTQITSWCYSYFIVFRNSVNVYYYFFMLVYRPMGSKLNRICCRCLKADILSHKRGFVHLCLFDAIYILEI